MIEIVIKIPKEDYERMKEKSMFGRVDIWKNAIKNGTPLPEHHGRLIDADEAIKILKSLGNRDYRREKGTIQYAEKMLSYYGYTPTIIEADKEEDNANCN
jgi:hypothetical protein